MKKCFLLLLIAFCVGQVFAIDPFTLKGKVVIIPPCYKEEHITAEDCKLHLFYSWKGGFDNVYSEKSLKHYSFNKKNKVEEELYGKELFIEDVVFIDKKNESRAVLFVVKKEGKRFVLHFPLFSVAVDGKEELYGFDGFLGDIEVESYSKGHFVWNLYSPYSLDLLVYEKEKVNAFNIENKGKSFFVNRAIKTVKGKPWQFDSVVFLWENYRYDSFMDERCLGWNNKSHQIPVCAKLKNGDDELYVDADSIGELFIEEKSFLDICEARYHDSYVDEFSNNYVGQYIHISSNKEIERSYIVSYVIDSRRGVISDEITRGSYYCDRVGLFYTNRRDSVYYSYHVVLHRMGDKGRDEQDIFCPINDFKRVDIELDSVYREGLKQIEIERQKKKEEKLLRLRQEEEKEKLEYYQILAKKYGKANAKLIADGEVRIGFTKEMCIEAWGEPEYINTTTTANGKIEQWVYGWFSYLYFKGNKLITIQDQE